MDYRRATYSSQIISGQISRAEALNKLKIISYDNKTIAKDKNYIAKKYGITFKEFDEHLSLNPKTYKDFPNNRAKIEWFYSLYRKKFN